jgi:succinate-semialdehyde dehydrogenase / glutarate-semialdehyde dehydrogenase
MADGASLIYGDLDFQLGGELANGFYIEPMVLEGIKFDSPSFHEAFNAPIFSLMKVKDANEALTYANRSDYGHGCTIFSNSPEMCQYLANRVRVGIVSINDSLYRGMDFPSGGIKDTGYGIDCHKHGLLEISNRKSVINKIW